ncbi:MAG: hypothetical protein ACI9LO_001777 [Planctomycetota bacterium]|jgi:hypothetical protein
MNIDQTRQFFEQVAAQDADTLCRIDASKRDISMREGVLVFSLTGLHAFLYPGKGDEFAAFKTMLYASELNRQLRDKGNEIVLYRSSGKIRSSLYCLKPL